MHKHALFGISIIACILINISCAYSQPIHLRLAQLSDILLSRISEKQLDRVDFPCLKFDSTLMVNARYDPPCIYVGHIQWAYSTTDDSLSIIYHEYQHHVMYLKKRYAVQLDEDGNILQWDTGETYLYQPLRAEVNLQLRRFLRTVIPTWEHNSLMPDSIKARHIETMERDLSKPQTMAFIYAPSNLAREEIVAYKLQLKGEKHGLYKLSETARTSIHIRIIQLKDTLKRRKRYERQHKLRADGSPKR